MTTTVEYAANLLTNTYILNDFGELAYIVCTIASPAAGSEARPSLSREQKLIRLKNAERQFRQHSILAALDYETFQLFTFYKKVDVVKDQKTILGKFGFITRSNACTIAYKAAARLPDLLKPENVRLHRLFVTAIISSIKVATSNALQVVSLGLRCYLIEAPNQPSSYQRSWEHSKWILNRIDLQILPNGQVLLTLARDNGVEFLRLHDVVDFKDQQSQGELQQTVLCLAPYGQVARFCKWIGEVETDELTELKEDSQRSFKRIWCKSLLKQLIGQKLDLPGVKDLEWAQVDIPTVTKDQEEGSNMNSHQENFSLDPLIRWKTIYWPVSLCYIAEPQHQNPPSEYFESSHNDPLQFIEDWVSSSAERAAELSKPQNVGKENSDEDEPLFSQEGTFEDPEQFQPFGPPAFPASHVIYPTPPDAVMTHATPGMSSVDGVALTPANPVRPIIESSQVSTDTEMRDANFTQVSGNESSFYDEDLFEEMPDDSYAHGAGGDEPNWDFFDEPDFEDTNGQNPQTEVSTSPVKLISKPSDNMSDERDQNHDVNEKAANFNEIQMNSNPDVSGGLENDSREDSKDESLSGIASDDRLQTERSRISIPRDFNSEEKRAHHDDQHIIHQNGQHGRKPSLYESVKSPTVAEDRDDRYSIRGDFWFDPTMGTHKPQTTSSVEGLARRLSTSSSGSLSSDNDSMSLDSEVETRHASPRTQNWTKYHPETANHGSEGTKVDETLLKTEVEYLLDLFSATNLGVLSGTQFQTLGLAFNHKTKMFDNRSVVGQLLVDQISQSIFQHQLPVMTLQRNSHRQSEDTNLDLSGINSSATYSTMSQMIGVKGNNSSKSFGRITKAEDWQISMNRGSRKLISSISILPFWDSLALQPWAGTKNFAAYCILPAGEDLRKNCLNFLNRISDAYTSCNLGSHGTRPLDELTDDGLITYLKDESAESNIITVCQKTGQAIAEVSDLQEDGIIVYMVSPEYNPISVLQLCIAFQALEQSFNQSLRDQRRSFDLKLQIIPESFIASPDKLVVPPQQDYVSLALEVYNRLLSQGHNSTLATSSSAMVLNKANSSVQFQLSTTEYSPLSENGPSLHVAYSFSLDNRWCTATWTDEYGHLATTMTYCLRITRRSKIRPRKEILKEIWELSQEMMENQRSKWRLIVTRIDLFEVTELNEWLHLANTETSQKSALCNLVLLSTDTNPPVEFMPSVLQARPSQPAFTTPQANVYGTPASTPQGSMTSPDHPIPATPTPGGTSMLSAATPPEQNIDPNAEIDYTLVNPSEECWNFVLPYGLNMSREILNVRTANLSGFLIKRKGTRDEDGFAAIAFHLIYSNTVDASSSITAKEELMENMINQFRGLVTLAVSRNCIDQIHECVPWHISTAIKGSRLLTQVM